MKIKLSPATEGPPASRPSTGLARLVYWLEDCFRVPGTDWRFGWEAIVGLLLPGVGDAAGLALGLPIVVEAFRRGHPWPVRWLMLANLGLDAFLGTVPLLGDAFDFLWKAQKKNLRLLEDPAALAEVVQEAKGRMALVAGAALVLFVLFLAGIAALAWATQRWLRGAGL